MDSSSRRNDRVSLASEWREQPRFLPGRCGARHPAGARRLLRCTFAFPHGLRGDDRQISRSHGPAGEVCQQLVNSEHGENITRSADVRSAAYQLTRLVSKIDGSQPQASPRDWPVAIAIERGSVRHRGLEKYGVDVGKRPSEGNSVAGKDSIECTAHCLQLLVVAQNTLSVIPVVIDRGKELF